MRALISPLMDVRTYIQIYLTPVFEYGKKPQTDVAYTRWSSYIPPVEMEVTIDFSTEEQQQITEIIAASGTSTNLDPAGADTYGYTNKITYDYDKLQTLLRDFAVDALRTCTVENKRTDIQSSNLVSDSETFGRLNQYLLKYTQGSDVSVPCFGAPVPDQTSVLDRIVIKRQTPQTTMVNTKAKVTSFAATQYSSSSQTTLRRQIEEAFLYAYKELNPL